MESHDSQLLRGYFSSSVELVVHVATDRMAQQDNARHCASLFWTAAWFRFYTPGDALPSHLSVLKSFERTVFSMQQVKMPEEGQAALS